MESVIFIAVLVGILAAIAIAQGGPSRLLQGVMHGGELAWGVLPNVILGFIAAGLVTTVVPASFIGALIGEEAGFRGVLLATAAGVLTPGGPFLQFPLVASLANGGASVSALAAYLSAWSLISLNRLIVWELPLLGVQFTAARWAISIFAPILIGLGTAAVHRLIVGR